jgi:RNA polymerase sigma-B factor
MEAIDAAHNYQPASLDAPIATDEDQSALAETLGDEDVGFELAEQRQALATSWATLSEVEREVLGLRLVGELTQREISQRIGCSQMHVSRLLRRSMIRLGAEAAPTR